MAATNHSSVR